MPTPTRSRVLAIIHNPRLPEAGRRPLSQALGWHDPDDLARRYAAAVLVGSHGLAEFEVVDRIEVDGFPVKADGFVYTPESYLACWRRRAGFHQPDGVDYHRLLDEFDVTAQVEGGRIDEVWLFGFPYAGYYESLMAGPGAVWCNAPPLRPGGRSPAPRRRFVIMGFNYERGVGEMLEDLGHRAESVLAHVFRGTRGDANLWEQFTRYDLTHPGRAECGNVHFAPNSARDYDWGNPRFVPSACDRWVNFPQSERRLRPVNCAEWGGGDIQAHHTWWFQHFPHADGESGGILHNWWPSVVDPNRL